MQRFAGKMITFSLITSIAMQFVFAVLFGIVYIRTKQTGAIVMAVIFLVVGLLLVWTFQYWKVRIPFARIMLKTVTNITARYPATITVAVVGLLLQTAFQICEG